MQRESNKCASLAVKTNIESACGLGLWFSELLWSDSWM
jgi:hypothetical protein